MAVSLFSLFFPHPVHPQGHRLSKVGSRNTTVPFLNAKTYRHKPISCPLLIKKARSFCRKLRLLASNLVRRTGYCPWRQSLGYPAARGVLRTMMEITKGFSWPSLCSKTSFDYLYTGRWPPKKCYHEFGHFWLSCRVLCSSGLLALHQARYFCHDQAYDPSVCPAGPCMIISTLMYKGMYVTNDWVTSERICDDIHWRLHSM